LESIGWTNGMCISDSRMLVNYYRTTRDGRLVFGRGGGKLAYGGKVGTSFDGASPRADDVAASMVGLYPSFRDKPVTHSWMGPIDRTQVGLPFFSRLLLAFGSFVGKHGFFLFSAFILGIGSSAWALSRPQVRSALNQRVWRMPAIGERMKTYQLARLYRTAGMLMRAGIPAVRALEMVEDLLAAHLRPQLRQARSLIEQGHAMSAALGTAGLATPVATRMMLVGERSGDMGQMLGQIARFHDEEVARFVDWFTRAFEPVLMAVLGIAIGLVVVLMYMPIFELAGNIK